LERGSDFDVPSWIRMVSRGLTGVELQRFPAYLAELNILIQLAIAASEADWQPAIPAVGVLCHDTLATHNPDRLVVERGDGTGGAGDHFQDPIREQSFEELCDPSTNATWFDAAVGNPP
jgi:hypothetical protein